MAFYYKHLDLSRRVLFIAGLACYSSIAGKVRRILFQNDATDVSILSCVLASHHIQMLIIKTAVFSSVAASSHIGISVRLSVSVFVWVF